MLLFPVQLLQAVAFYFLFVLMSAECVSRCDSSTIIVNTISVHLDLVVQHTVRSRQLSLCISFSYQLHSHRDTSRFDQFCGQSRCNHTGIKIKYELVCMRFTSNVSADGLPLSKPKLVALSIHWKFKMKNWLTEENTCQEQLDSSIYASSRIDCNLW